MASLVPLHHIAPDTHTPTLPLPLPVPTAAHRRFLLCAVCAGVAGSGTGRALGTGLHGAQLHVWLPCAATLSACRPGSAHASGKAMGRIGWQLRGLSAAARPACCCCPPNAHSAAADRTPPLTHRQALLDSWFGLWQWVFQPAIGVLMMGAVSACARVCGRGGGAYRLEAAAAPGGGASGARHCPAPTPHPLPPHTHPCSSCLAGWAGPRARWRRGSSSSSDESWHCGEGACHKRACWRLCGGVALRCRLLKQL